VASVRNQFGPFLVEVLQQPRKENTVSILWIILIVVLVLALLGFVGRGF
jgi:flagellar basal body-associated protein FliL